MTFQKPESGDYGSIALQFVVLSRAISIARSVPRVLLYDNLKSAVLERSGDTTAARSRLPNLQGFAEEEDGEQGGEDGHEVDVVAGVGGADQLDLVHPAVAAGLEQQEMSSTAMGYPGRRARARNWRSSWWTSVGQGSANRVRGRISCLPANAGWVMRDMEIHPRVERRQGSEAATWSMN